MSRKTWLIVFALLGVEYPILRAVFGFGHHTATQWIAMVVAGVVSVVTLATLATIARRHRQRAL